MWIYYYCDDHHHYYYYYYYYYYYCCCYYYDYYYYYYYYSTSEHLDAKLMFSGLQQWDVFETENSAVRKQRSAAWKKEG